MAAALDHCLDRSGVAKVGAIIMRLGARRRLELEADRLDFLRVAEAVDHHAGAFERQRPGDGEADARRRSGNERSLALKLHKLRFSFGR